MKSETSSFEYRTIFENAQIGMVIVQDGRICLCNPWFRNKLGYSEDEIVSKKFIEFVRDDYIAIINKKCADCMAGKSIESTCRCEFISSDDKYFIMEIHSSIIEFGVSKAVLCLITDVIERSKHEKNVVDEGEWIRLLLNMSNDGIAIINQHHQVVEANARFCEMLGYTYEELRSLKTWDWEASLTEEEIERGFRDLTKVKTTFESKHRRKDGSTYDVEVSASGSTIGGEVLVITISRDISDRKDAEAALRFSEQRFRGLFENLERIAVQGYDEERRVVYWNRASEILCGYRQKEAMGRPIEELIVPEPQRPGIVRAMANWAENGIPLPDGEVEFLRKDGALVPVYASHVMQKATDGKKEMFSLGVDLTEVKRAHENMLRAEEKAEIANRISRTKSEFLANMSHEIRTPLNGILGMLQLLEASGLDAEQKDVTDMAIQSSIRLAELLADILDISRVEAGKLEIQRVPFNLQKTVQNVYNLFKAMAKESGLDIKFHVDPSIPEVLLGDPGRIQQVLNNLVGNAIKFTHAGTINLEAYPIPTQEQQEQRVLFMVSDTGIGIPYDQLDGIFNSFTQVSKGLTREHQGAGLGLSITRNLVELMGGNIAVESEIGFGTIFHFYITLGLCNSEERLAPQTETKDVDLPPGRRVLLVEDDLVGSLAVERFLEKAGCEVETARNGLQSLEALRQKDFDAVLMDMQMPVMNGLAVTRSIRAGEAGKGNKAIPIIALTAFAMEEDKQTILASGVDDYIAKPVTMAALKQALFKVLKRD